MAFLNFKYGSQATLPAFASAQEGAVYVTTDKSELFIKLPGQTDYVNIGDFQLVEYSSGEALTALNNLAASLKRKNILYIAVNGDTTGMYRWTGSTFVAITNSTEISDILSRLTAVETKANSADTTAKAALPKSGGIMTGEIAMSGKKITGLGAPTAGSSDAATAAYAEAKANAVLGASGDDATKNTVYGAKAAAAQAQADANEAKNGVSTNASSINTLNGNLNTLTGRVSTAEQEIDTIQASYVNKDGTVAMTGNLAMGNNKITGLANGSAATDAVTYGQLTSLKSTLESKDTQLSSSIDGLDSRIDTLENATSSYMPKAGGQFTGNVSFASGSTLTVAEPEDDTDAANKKYVDDTKAGIMGTSGTAGNTVYGALKAAADADTKAGAAQSAADTAQARADSAYSLADGKAPKDHAASATIYGVGSSSKYGHVKLNDGGGTDEGAGIAATPGYVVSAVNTAKSELQTKIDTAQSNAESHAETYAAGVAATAKSEAIAEAKTYTDGQITAVNKTIDDLEASIGNLSNVMNFRGTVDSTDDVSSPASGDVVIVGNKEMVYDGTTWKEIGDVTAQAEAISTLQSSVNTLRTDVNNNDADISGLTTRMGTAETNITNLKNTVGTKPSSPTMDTTLWDEVADLRSDLGEKGDAANATGSAFARIASNKTSIATNTSAISSNAATIATHTTSINDLKTLMTWGTF